MSAEKLTAAADKIEKLLADQYLLHKGTWRTEPGPAGYAEIHASGHQPGDPEFCVDPGFHDTYVCQMDTPSTAEVIVAAVNAVSPHLVAWLRETAESWRLGVDYSEEALKVAERILGGDQ